MLVQSGKIYKGRRSPGNSLLKKPRQQLLQTGSLAPSPAGCLPHSAAFVSCSWLETVWESLSKEADDIPTSNRTPNYRILDGLHSPSRFCHCWPKPARRAPTNAPSLAGTFRRSSHLLGSTTLRLSARVPGEGTSCGVCGGEETDSSPVLDVHSVRRSHTMEPSLYHLT